MFVKKN